MEPLPVPSIYLPNNHLRFRGFFRLYTTNAAGEITKDTGVFPNLITNGGLDFIGACSNNNMPYGLADFTSSCSIGLGNTTPAVTDVYLTSFLNLAYDDSGSGCNVNTQYVAGPPAYWQGQRSWQFAAGSATGNIAELGVGPFGAAAGPVTSPGRPLFSHALVVDGSGNPTVIPVLATEALTVTYILQIYMDLTDTAYTMSLSGTPYSGIFRRASVTTVPFFMGLSLLTLQAGNPSNYCTVYNGSIGTVTQSPSGSSYQSVLGDPGYTTGTYTKSLTASFDINSGNLSGGITAIGWVIFAGGGWQMSVSPTIPKTSTYNMTLSSSYSWSRYP